MLKLVRCEFSKLKRKKFILLVVLSAFLFPVPLTALMTMPQTAGQYDSKIDIFNDYFQFVMGYGVGLLLPCMIGVIAAMLFFMERDNDTFKNAEVNSIVYRLFFALEMGIFITAGTLPLVVLVVFFSKTYVFSVLLCVFYSVLSLTAESSFGALPKLMCWLMPIPLTTLWSAGNLTSHGVMSGVGMLEYLIPTTFQTIMILTVIALLSVLLIDYMYKKRGDE